MLLGWLGLIVAVIGTFVLATVMLLAPAAPGSGRCTTSPASAGTGRNPAGRPPSTRSSGRPERCSCWPCSPGSR
ncbi:hypothetical protein V2I01_29890 [Micromonospora sp. BRA006-A]|nr:hypothetical protein [Micromonospora sp. BRA006-A]